MVELSRCDRDNCDSNYIPEHQHQSMAVWREGFPQRDGMQTGRSPTLGPCAPLGQTHNLLLWVNCPLQQLRQDTTLLRVEKKVHWGSYIEL